MLKDPIDDDLPKKVNEQLFGLDLLKKNSNETEFNMDNLGVVLKKLRFKEVLIGSVIVEDIKLMKRLLNLENSNLASFRKVIVLKNFLNFLLEIIYLFFVFFYRLIWCDPAKQTKSI